MTRTATIAEAILALPRPLLLAFDVDGTLAPIVDDPQAAAVPTALQSALRKLARTKGLRVALVTGRDRAALSRMLRVPGAYRAFEHGRVIIAPGERPKAQQLSADERAKLDAFARWAEAEAVPQGAELEHKPQSRGLHVRRLASRNPDQAEALLDAATARARDLGLHARPGRSVLEAELSPGDKGTAVRNLVKRTRAKGVVYCGDDLTDIPALRAAVDLGGIGVFVRSPERPRKPTGVSHSVDGPEGITALVEQLSHA